MKFFTTLIFIVFVSGCGQGEWDGYQLIDQKWKYKKLDKYSNLRTKVPSEGDRKLIRLFIKLYESKGHELEYNQLVFDKVLADEELKTRLFLFDIKYVDDIQAVFRVDINDDLIGNFLVSSF